MPRRAIFLVLAVCAWFGGCSNRPPVDNAPPVAIPSLAVSPSVVASGSPLQLSMKFVIAPDAPPFQEDYTVFVHVIDDDGRMIGAIDHEPPTPTREWKAGSTVEYSHAGYAPTSNYVGMATMVVGLYSRATGQRLPLAGETFEPRAVKVSTFEMRERDDPYAVAFHEGWHPPESPKGSGAEWRWTKKSARVTFPNPHQPVELVLDVDQPLAVFPIAQHVEIRLGPSVADAFDLEPKTPQLRRVQLSQTQMGETPMVELVLVSDKTLIPANVAALQNSDTRQLGIRVFRIYVEPKQ